MDKSGQLYIDENPPEEDKERAEKEWGDEVERKHHAFDEQLEKLKAADT